MSGIRWGTRRDTPADLRRRINELDDALRRTRAERDEYRDEVLTLTRWKAEAIAVINGWEAAAAPIEPYIQLGQSRYAHLGRWFRLLSRGQHVMFRTEEGTDATAVRHEI